MPRKRRPQKQPSAALPDAVSKWRIQAAQELAEIDITPLEVMLAGMRMYWDMAESYRQAKEIAVMTGGEDDAVYYNNQMFLQIKEAVSIAQKCANYVHPRLLSTNSTIDAGPLTIELVKFTEAKQIESKTTSE